jgi:hypothetical protein
MDIFSCFGMWNSCPKFVCDFQLQPYRPIFFAYQRLRKERHITLDTRVSVQAVRRDKNAQFIKMI